MLRSGCLALFALTLCSYLPGFAQDSTHPSNPGNLATVAFNAAVIQTAEAKREFGVLQTKFAPREAHLQALNTEIENLRKQVSDAAISEPQKTAKQQTLDTKERQLQREVEDFKADSDSASQQAFQAVAQKLYAFLQEYAKQHSYSVVIDRGSDSSPIVWYAAGNLDITGDLIKAYDQKPPTASTSPRAEPSAGTPPLPSAPKPH